MTPEQRQEMSDYLIGERFFSNEELAQMSDEEIRMHYVDMHEQIDEMEAINGDTYAAADELRAELRSE